VNKFGFLHVALNCAGVAWPGMTLSSKGGLDTNLFKKVIEINLYGTIYVSKYASIQMSKQEKVNERGEKGVIINVSSVAAEEA